MIVRLKVSSETVRFCESTFVNLDGYRIFAANVSESGAIIEEEETETDLHGFNFKILKYFNRLWRIIFSKDCYPDLKDSLFFVEDLHQDLKVFFYRDLHPNLKDNLNEFKLHMFESDELTPLKVWQLQDLSFQAGQRIVNAQQNEALQILTDISQNFPVMARYARFFSVRLTEIDNARFFIQIFNDKPGQKRIS